MSHEVSSNVDFSFEQSKGSLDTLRAEIISEVKRYHVGMLIPDDLAVSRSSYYDVQSQRSAQPSPLGADLSIATESTGANSIFDQQHLSSSVSVSGEVIAPVADSSEDMAVCSELYSDIENCDPNYDLIYGLPVSSVLMERSFQSRPPLVPRRPVHERSMEQMVPKESLESDVVLQRRTSSRVPPSSSLRQPRRSDGIANPRFRSSSNAKSVYRSKSQMPPIKFATPFTVNFDVIEESECNLNDNSDEIFDDIKVTVIIRHRIHY
jgi:hypothetical protein